MLVTWWNRRTVWYFNHRVWATVYPRVDPRTRISSRYATTLAGQPTAGTIDGGFVGSLNMAPLLRRL